MSDSIFGGKAAGMSSQEEFAALAKDFPDLAKDSAPPAEAPAPEAPAAAPEKPAEAAPPATDAKPPEPADPTQKPPEAPPAKPEGKDGEGHGPVPYKALAEAREKAREIEAAAAAREAALQQQLQQMQGQIQQLGQLLRPQAPQPQAQQEEPPPDPDADPIGALRYERQQRERLQQELVASNQRAQVQTARQEIARAYVGDAQRFAGATPDFEAAYNHLKAQRVAVLRAAGWQDQAIPAQIENEEMGVVVGAMRAGKSPAQQIYDLAVAGGYVKAPPPAPPPAAPVAPPAPPPVDPALAEAKAKAAAGHREGGTAPTAELTFEDAVKTLKGAAFDSWYAKWQKSNNTGNHAAKHGVFRN